MSSVGIIIQNFAVLVVMLISTYYIVYGKLLDKIIGIGVLLTIQFAIMSYRSLV